MVYGHGNPENPKPLFSRVDVTSYFGSLYAASVGNWFKQRILEFLGHGLDRCPLQAPVAGAVRRLHSPEPRRPRARRLQCNIKHACSTPAAWQLRRCCARSDKKKVISSNIIDFSPDDLDDRRNRVAATVQRFVLLVLQMLEAP